MEKILTEDELKKYGYTHIEKIPSYSNSKIYESQKNEWKCPSGKIKKVKVKKGYIRLMTFNVHNFTTVCTNDKLKKDLKKFIKFFKDTKVDILLLQEFIPVAEKPIFTEHTEYPNFDYITNEFKKIGLKYNFICNVMRDGLKKSEPKGYYYLANAIFSKIPFEGECYQLPSNRGMIIAKFKKISIVNIHGEYWNDDLINYIIPEKYNKDLIKYQWNLIEEKLKNEKNLIIAGDFNLPYKIWDNPQFKRFRYRNIKERMHWIRTNFIDPFNIPIEDRRTNLSQNLATDFIMIKKGTKVSHDNTIIYDSNLSDHLPLSIDLLLEDIQ